MYIVDIYNEFGHNKDVIQVSRINGLVLCIRKITKLEWGQPVFPDKSIESEHIKYHIYENLEDACKYLHDLRYFASVNI